MTAFDPFKYNITYQVIGGIRYNTMYYQSSNRTENSIFRKQSLNMIPNNPLSSGNMVLDKYQKNLIKKEISKLEITLKKQPNRTDLRMKILELRKVLAKGKR